MRLTTGSFAGACLAGALACSPEAERAPDRTVAVEAVSYAYQPSSFSVAPGTIRFVVRNTADEVHGFEVEGHGLEEALERIPPGESDSLTVTLTEPGEYRIYCPVDDHEERGMVGSLVVGGEATG